MKSIKPTSIPGRRDFLLKSGIATTSAFIPVHFLNSTPLKIAQNPVFKGVNIGAITYSFRSMSDKAEDLLGYMVDLGLTTTELMGGSIESYAGAPQGPPRKRGELTAEEKKERSTHKEALRKWRTSVGMMKFKELRKKYNDNGVTIDIAKFNLSNMTPEEIKYAFKAAESLGSRGITLERSDEAIDLLSAYADKYKSMIGYHNHAKVDFNSWDKAMTLSKYNAINLDVGHYVAGTNQSPIPLIKKYGDRILNLHLKDRKKNNGENMPWGQGDTPLKEVLQLMRDEKYKFMGTIELEYPIPEGSDAVKEVRNCIEFCKNAIG